MTTDAETRIEPALTAEEWTTKRVTPHQPTAMELRAGDWDVGPALTPSGVVWEYVSEGCDRGITLDPRHATAALCLYGQPFGFTREDVDMLRGLADGAELGIDTETLKFGAWCNSLADRIAALLPPE